MGKNSTLTLLAMLAIIMIEPLMVFAVQSNVTFTITSTSIEAKLVRSPEEVYSMQPALIFAHVIGEFKSIELKVTVHIRATLEPKIPGVDVPSPLEITYTAPMLPVLLAQGWYFVSIPGFPAETYKFEYDPPGPPPPISVCLRVESEVSYKLIVDGKIVSSDSYTVLEGRGRTLPPLVFSIVHDAVKDRSILDETFGLGPKGWALHVEPLKVLILAIDDKEVSRIDFEYRVSKGPWMQASVREDPLMKEIREFISRVNEFIRWIEEEIRKIRIEVDIPEISISILIANAEIPAQRLGSYVMFRANATDVDGNKLTSPIGFYYVVNKKSDVRILVVDPFVWLWLLEENFNQFTSLLKQSTDYDLPADILGDMAFVNKAAELIEKYGIVPFHHWELLGKHYNLYVIWPNERIKGFLKDKAEGGFEPHVIILSNLMLGFNGTETGYWNWDLKDVGVLSDIVKYVKKKHSGLIATHGTLSDWVVWTSPEPKGHCKVGSRGHVGDTIEDIDIIEERTIAALLGIPYLAVWELVRDMIASILCASETTLPLGLIVGSIPLQASYVPFNGSMSLTREGELLGWKVPKEFSIMIPGVHQELSVSAYTQVGWQLGMPRALAYLAWKKADEYEPLTRRLYERLSRLMENVTERVYAKEKVEGHLSSSLKWGLLSFYRSIVAANISDSTFTLSVYVPALKENVTLTIDVGKALEQLLRLLPSKLVAISKDHMAGIIAYDKYWDENGYRSVYFSFEVEAIEGEIGERLLVEAVEWTRRWEYKDITTLLRGLVRIPKEMAKRFEDAIKKAPGVEIISKGLLLTEEGRNVININVTEFSVYRAVIAHPTSDKANVTIFEGPVKVLVTSIIERLTEVVLIANKTGVAKLGLSVNPDSSLNLGYIVIKHEIAPQPIVEPIRPEDKFYTNTTRVMFSAKASGYVKRAALIINGIEYDMTFNDKTGLYERVLTLKDGAYKWYVKVFDIFDRVSTSLERILTVDTVPPLVIIESPKAESLLKGEVMITFTALDDNFDRVELYINGSLVKTWIEFGVQAFKWDTTKVKDGAYVVELIAYDKAANKFKSSVKVIVDNTPPILKIIHPTEGAVIMNETVVISWSSIDETSGIAKVELSLDDGPWIDVTDKTSYVVKLIEGFHFVRIKATDRAGNAAEGHVRFSIKLVKLIPMFKVSNLIISPAEVMKGEIVRIYVDVENIGNATGTYKVALTIDGILEDEKEVVLAAGASIRVVFELKKEVAKTYIVGVNGLRGTLSVKEPIVVAPPIDILLPIIGIIAIVVISTLAFLAKRKRK